MKDDARKRIRPILLIAAVVSAMAIGVAGVKVLLLSDEISGAGTPPRRVEHTAAAKTSMPSKSVARLSRRPTAGRNKNRVDNESVKRLLALTQRLVRARDNLLIQKQRLEAAEIAARQAKADADRAKFEALKKIFQKDPETALGDKVLPSARRTNQAKYGNRFAQPPFASPWASFSLAKGPRVKAVQDIALGKSALVEMDGRTFLVREGHEIGSYRVAKITPDGVLFVAKKGGKKTFSPLAAASGKQLVSASPASRPPFMTPPPEAFVRGKRGPKRRSGR